MTVFKPGCSVIENQKWAKDSTFVSVDENVTVFRVMTNGDFRRNRTSASAVLELREKVLSVFVHTVNVTVDVNTITVCPVLRLVNIKLIEAFSDFLRVNLFGDVDHLRSVLYKTTILTLWRLVRT